MQPGSPYPQPVQPPARQLGLGDLLVAAGGLFVFLFSFAPFVSELGGGLWFNAWSRFSLAPLTLWVIFSGVLLVGLAVMHLLTGRELDLVGFRHTHFEVGLGLFNFFVLIGLAMSELPFAWGGVLMLISSIVALAGALLNHFNVGPAFAARMPRAGAAQPGGYPPQPPVS